MLLYISQLRIQLISTASRGSKMRSTSQKGLINAVIYLFILIRRVDLKVELANRTDVG